MSSTDGTSEACVELTLDRADAYYLREDAAAAGAAAEAVEHPDLDGAHHGEPVSISIFVALTAAGLKALTAFYDRSRRQGRVTYSVTTITPDGNQRKEELTVDFNDGSRSVMQQLGAALGMAAPLIKAAEALG